MTLRDIVGRLNEWLENDPRLVQNVFGSKAGPVNEWTCNHELFAVSVDESTGIVSIGMLGILNGLMTHAHRRDGSIDHVIATRNKDGAIERFEIGRFCGGRLSPETAR